MSWFYRRLSKSNTEREPFGTLLGHFGQPRPTDHATNLAIGAITPKTSENTTFLMALGLKHRKTRVLEGSSLAVASAAGARGLWRAGKTTIWHAKVRFYQGFSYFSESEVGAGT